MKIDVVVNIVAEAVVGVNRNWELSRGEVGNLASENVENCCDQQKKSRDSEILPTGQPIMSGFGNPSYTGGR